MSNILIEFGIIGAVASIVGCAFGVYLGMLVRKDLRKTISNRDKEIRYMKDQVEGFRYKLDLLLVELSEGKFDIHGYPKKVNELADDAFERFDYEHCAMHSEE